MCPLGFSMLNICVHNIHKQLTSMCTYCCSLSIKYFVRNTSVLTNTWAQRQLNQISLGQISYLTAILVIFWAAVFRVTDIQGILYTLTWLGKEIHLCNYLSGLHFNNTFWNTNKMWQHQRSVCLWLYTDLENDYPLSSPPYKP